MRLRSADPADPPRIDIAHLRHPEDMTRMIDALKEVAAGSDNLMPAILDCVRVRATEGEIIAALKQVFGTYRETPAF